MSDLYFPPAGDDWEQVEPASVGWDPQQVDRALAFAAARDSTGVAILHGGRIVAERYWQDSDQSTTSHIASGQKSILSVLIGMAVADGVLDIHDRVDRHLGPGWSMGAREQESRITLRHLITMTSGLDNDLAPKAEPGTRWYYNDPAYFRAKAVLEASTATPIEEYTRKRLWEPLGTGHSRWELLDFTIDAQRTPIEGVHMTVRDMARFGLMMLAGGSWAGSDLGIDPGYLKASLETSQEPNPSYGYLWWLNGKASWVMPGPTLLAGDEPIFPDAPPDLFAALGAQDKKIYIIPSREIVVTRLGGLAAVEGANLWDFDNEFLRLIVAAAPAV